MDVVLKVYETTLERLVKAAILIKGHAILWKDVCYPHLENYNDKVHLSSKCFVIIKSFITCKL